MEDISLKLCMREDKIYKGEFVSIFREENNYGYMAMIKISKEGD